MAQLKCHCGKVKMEVEGVSIINAECHCNSCREAANIIQSDYTEINGGTQYVLYRKDKVRCIAGLEDIELFKLRPESKTRRAFAKCCNTPLFLEFQSGHWLSIFACLWPQSSRPHMDERTMVSDLDDTSKLGNQLKNSQRQSLKFMYRLLKSWAQMGFKSSRYEIK